MPSHVANLFVGQNVVVVPDADLSGMTGASKWLEALKVISARVIAVKPPYEVEEKHGKDLRHASFDSSSNYSSIERTFGVA